MERSAKKRPRAQLGGFLREGSPHTWDRSTYPKIKGVGSGFWGMFSGVCWKVLRMFGCLVDWIGNCIVFS